MDLNSIVDLQYVFENSTESGSTIQTFNAGEYIKNILKNDLDGKFIQTNEKSINLTEGQRNLLTRLIVKHVYHTFGGRVSGEVFAILSQGIIECFPKENQATYYVPYCKLTKTLATGKLWYCFNNYKKKIVVMNTKPTNEITNLIGLTESDEIKWLESNVSPWSKVLEIWNESFSFRNEYLKNCSIFEYYEKFPALSTEKGYELLISDFQKKHSADDFIANWNIIKPKIIKLLNEKKVTIVSNEDAVILHLLPYLVPPTFVTSTKRTITGEEKISKIKPSIVEVQTAFILNVVNPADINSAIRERRTILLARKASFQPTPIFVGPLTAVEGFYVLVNDTLYPATSALDAVKICFQIIFSLQAEYPDEAKQVWLLIQYTLGKIKNSNDKPSIKLHTLIGVLT